jgi:hypothetical protein
LRAEPLHEADYIRTAFGCCAEVAERKEMIMKDGSAAES